MKSITAIVSSNACSYFFSSISVCTQISAIEKYFMTGYLLNRLEIIPVEGFAITGFFITDWVNNNCEPLPGKLSEKVVNKVCAQLEIKWKPNASEFIRIAKVNRIEGKAKCVNYMISGGQKACI